ncbi:nuclear pore glycoprotein p62-like isoform X1 [Gavia stellata]|uniref:nuclear pore glycoprotein p62-like isoform X1 n=1 Tax=Gavia stellata TaxID=37040 RepID=UPI00289693C4|nr:nuclear pore glycoprotein p62-like isoform X1 [Gavia stellata]
MNQFNLGSGAAGGGFTFGTPKAAATTATTGFSFSTPAASGGFSFGSAAQTSASSQPAGLFSFSTPGTAAQPASFSFGTPATASAAPAANVFPLGANAPKLNFGGSTATQATGITGGFGFSGSVPASVPSSQAAAPSGFVFGSAGTTTTATAAVSGTTGGFTFSSGATTQAGTASFSIGTAAPQAAPTGLTFGTAPAAAATTAATLGAATQSTTPFSLGGQSAVLNFGSLPSTAATSAPMATLTTSTTQGPALSFGTKLGVTSTAATAASTTTTSILGSTGPTLFASIVSSSAPTSSTSTGLSLGAPSTGTASLGTLGFGLKVPGTTAAATSTATSTTSASGFALNLKPLTTTGAIGAGTSAAAITTTTTTSAPPVMTYAQLESLINKWSLELEDQEKHFLHQATQVNAWDRTLIENGEKITSLHREVEKVKLDQKRLDQELDFILSQQKELEDLLTPLEESVKEQSGTIYLQHADEERERTYKLAENIDAQLKRMAQDLKDIIEHLNTSGGPADTSDPLQQICKILNAHMDSLQWIDQNSAVLQRKVEEVTKVCESRRKEQERSFRITFD